MKTTSRRLTLLLAIAAVLATSLLARGPAGAPQASAACADTVLVRAVKRYTITSGSQVVYSEPCTLTAVPGRRFLIEVLRPGGTNPLTSAQVAYGGIEYFGLNDVDGSNVLLSRVATPQGVGTLTVTLKGSAGAKLDLRVTQVPEPLYTVYASPWLTGAVSEKWYTKYFDFPGGTPATPHVMTLTNGLATPGDSARATNPEVWLNSQQVIFPGEVDPGRSFVTRNVTLDATNTLQVKLKTSQSGKRVSVKVAATDVSAPGLLVTWPADSFVTSAAKVLRAVQASDSQTATRLRVDGVDKPLTSGVWSDSVALPAQDGKTTYTFTAENGACLTATQSRTVIRDTRAPTLVVTTPAAVPAVTVVDTSVHVQVIQGTWVDSTVTTIDVDGVVAASGQSGSQPTGFQSAPVPLDMGPNRILIRATDQVGHVTSVWRYVNRVVLNEATVNPVVSSPPLASTQATSFLDATMFLYTGNPPLQTGVVANTMDTLRVAVVRGKVFSRDIGPLPNVVVKVLGHGEYGQTVTRADGRFDLAVNGGAPLTLRFAKSGYLEVQRTLLVPTNDYITVDSVALIGRSSRALPVNVASAPAMIQSRFESDANGDRKLALSFRQGTSAQVVRAPGDTVNIGNAITVRAKEYTVGNGGPTAMPAALPASTAYTYCVSLSLDEADALGAPGEPAPEVRFTQPVGCYVRDFLHLPIGTAIPAGYYDPRKGQWLAGEDGVVLKIVGVANGLAMVDADTLIGADSTSALLALGLDDSERLSLAQQYAVGDTLWRVRVDHFSEWDFNLNLAWLAYSKSPAAARARRMLGLVPCSTKRPGSIIECENRVLGEEIPLAGSPYSLNYRSYRMPGDVAMRKLRIPLVGDSLPSQVRVVHVVVDVAGQQIKQDFDPPLDANYVATLTWDATTGLAVRCWARSPHGSASATSIRSSWESRPAVAAARWVYLGRARIAR
jgi:hypothetical protein